MAWENRRLARGAEPLIDPAMLRNPVLRGGLTAFFFQYLLQAGLFFAVPLFLSVALGLSAIATGVRLLPLSITLLLAAVGHPQGLPRTRHPAGSSQLGFLALFAGIVVMVAALDAGAGPEIVTWPMLLAGLGIGALASQLGAVTVSSVPDEQSGEVGGLQNTVTNLGASIGTALAGAVLISGADHLVPHRHRARTPTCPPRSPPNAAGRARRAASRSSPTPTSRPRSTRRGCRRDGATPSSRRTRPPASTGCVRRCRSSPCIALIALFFTRSLRTGNPERRRCDRGSGQPLTPCLGCAAVSSSVTTASYCRICAAACGILVTVDDEGSVTKVRGDPDHPASRGYVCSKGRGLAAWHHRADRLDHPRLHGERTTWDDVLDDLRRARLDARTAHGPDSVGLYLATGFAYDAAGQMAAPTWLAMAREPVLLHRGHRRQRAGAGGGAARHRPPHAQPRLGSGIGRGAGARGHQPGRLARVRHRPSPTRSATSASTASGAGRCG